MRFNIKTTLFITTISILSTISCKSYIETMVPRIEITVSSTSQPNAITGQPATDLWAATTRYETDGYEFEKVNLVSQNDGSSYYGKLPVKVGTEGSVSIVIWDDTVTEAHITGGNQAVGPQVSNVRIVETAGYFTPCALSTSGAIPLSSYLSGSKIFLNWTATVLTNNVPSKEISANVVAEVGGSVSINYPSQMVFPNANHCNCLLNPIVWGKVKQLKSPATNVTPPFASVSNSFWVVNAYAKGPTAYHWPNITTTTTTSPWILTNYPNYTYTFYKAIQFSKLFTDTDPINPGGACNARLQ